MSVCGGGVYQVLLVQVGVDAVQLGDQVLVLAVAGLIHHALEVGTIHERLAYD